MTIGGNVSSVGTTLRIEVTNNGAVVTPIDDYKIINASKLSSSSVLAHFATYHTTHNRANSISCIMFARYYSKNNDGTSCVKNHSDTDYEVAYRSKRSTNKLANHSRTEKASCFVDF